MFLDLMKSCGIFCVRLCAWWCCCQGPEFLDIAKDVPSSSEHGEDSGQLANALTYLFVFFECFKIERHCAFFL